MRLLFLVNDPLDIQAKQTTAMLLFAAVQQGHQVGVLGVGDISCLPRGAIAGNVRWVEAEQLDNLDDFQQRVNGITRLVKSIENIAISKAYLTDVDMLFIRTNPARDPARAALHQFALHTCAHCAHNGVKVINSPSGLNQASTKQYLMELPEHCRPTTTVSSSREEIKCFIEDIKTPVVLKPLSGTRGNGVFKVDSVNDTNLNQILDTLLLDNLVMAQEALPGASKGDTRVVVLNGKILSVDDTPATISRIPQKGDFRSNIHVGGHPAPGVLTTEMRKVIDDIGPKLVNDGLSLVGLDFIDNRIIEVNVFSTGGLHDAERFTGKYFSDTVVGSFLDKNNRESNTPNSSYGLV